MARTMELSFKAIFRPGTPIDCNDLRVGEHTLSEIVDHLKILLGPELTSTVREDESGMIFQ